MTDVDDILTLAEAAELCGLERRSLSMAARRGSLRTRLAGRSPVLMRLTTRQALAEYLAWAAAHRANPNVSRADYEVALREGIIEPHNDGWRAAGLLVASGKRSGAGPSAPDETRQRAIPVVTVETTDGEFVHAPGFPEDGTPIEEVVAFNREHGVETQVIATEDES